MLATLLRELYNQINQLGVSDKVEVLVEIDDRQITTGAKRNLLIKKATGEYVVFADDDDFLYPYYVSEILKALESKPDAVAMNGIITTNGGKPEKWFISKDNEYVTKIIGGERQYFRFHNHLSPVKRQIAKNFPFPDKSYGEDYEYALALHQSGWIKTETKIDKPMYHYRYIQKPNK